MLFWKKRPAPAAEERPALSPDFIEEIRSYDAADLRCIIDEQEALYTPEEFAYIRAVFAERLGDIT